MSRHRNFKGVVIPSAARWEIHTCMHCPNVHLILFDDSDMPFAEAVMGREGVEKFFKHGIDLINKLRQMNIDRQNEGS